MNQIPDSPLGMDARVILTGGGLDSTAITLFEATQWARPNRLRTLYHVDYGQVSGAQEFAAVTSLADRINALSGQSIAARSILCRHDASIQRANPDSLLLGTGTNAFVRGRNLWLLHQAAAAAIEEHGSKNTIVIVMGLCRERMMFPDADSEFIRLARELLARSFGTTDSAARPLVTLEAPLISVPKLEAMRLAHRCAERLGLGHAAARELVFSTSFTCWTPDEHGHECGVCAHCEKKRALMQELYEVAS